MFFENKIFEIRREGYLTVLDIHLRLADKKDLALSQTAGELRIGIWN